MLVSTSIASGAAGSRGEVEGGVDPVTGGEVVGGGRRGRTCEEAALRAEGASTSSTSMSAGGAGGCGEDGNGVFILGSCGMGPAGSALGPTNERTSKPKDVTNGLKC